MRLRLDCGAGIRPDRRRWLPWILLLGVLLQACATPRHTRPSRTTAPAQVPMADAHALALAETALSARESALFEQQDFQLQGRLGVSNGKDAGSGQFQWIQTGDQFDFSLRVTLTGDRVRLAGRPGRVTLTDAEGRQQTGFDAEQLLLERTGWRVPVAQLAYWIRAMRAPGALAEPGYTRDGQLHSLRQSGWSIGYRSWTRDRTPALPIRLEARSGEHAVKVVVRQWQ